MHIKNKIEYDIRRNTANNIYMKVCERIRIEVSQAVLQANLTRLSYGHVSKMKFLKFTKASLKSLQA